MIIRHLQLNTSALKSPVEIVEYLVANDVDVACLQEIVYPTGSVSPIKELAEKEGYQYLEAVHFTYLDKNLTVGLAILTKFPIEDYDTLYFNTENYQPKEISDKDFVGEILVEDDNIKESMASRGLKHSVKSRAILTATVSIDGKKVRMISINYTVSSWATETEQMFKMSQLLTSKVQFSKDLPTIVSGDMNLQSDSYSVALIKTQLQHHSGRLKSTLSESHRALATDFPDGLAVDHVFSKGLKHISTEANQIDFSDHKVLLSEFELL